MNRTLDWHISVGISYELVILNLYLRPSRGIPKVSRSSFDAIAGDEPSDCRNHL